MIKEIRIPNCALKSDISARDICYVSIPTGVRGKIRNLRLRKVPMEVAGISRILSRQVEKPNLNFL